MQGEIRVSGLRELEAALKALPAEMQLAALNTGLIAAAKVTQEGMSRRAPRDPVVAGHTLAREILYKIAPPIAGQPRVIVGPSRDVFYGGILEFGTRFVAPRSFMRRTISEDLPQIVNGFAAGMRFAFDSIVKRLRSQKVAARLGRA